MGRATLCPTCGTALRETARFCDACGSALSAPRAEYKLATVLFVDVVRSMDIASIVGAERLGEIMTGLAARCAAVVKAYGGTVDKFTGDGIMALFGAPVALEDHAVRACLAALDIQDVARTLGPEIERRDGIEFRLRVGLNSGEIVAGDVGGTVGYAVFGEHVGLAQRMESAAPPGGVLLSESTVRLVDHAVVLGESEMVRVKGFPAAIPARRLLAASTTDSKIGHIGQDLSTLVGRTSELDALRDLLDRVTAGDSCVVSVVGAAGIGKSRIVSEATSRARMGGVDVVVAHCESHGMGIPFHVGARLLRAVFGVSALDAETGRVRLRAVLADADPADVALFEDLLGIGEPGAELPEVGPDARRRRLRTLVSASLSARLAPTIYVIEDIHWIDELSDAVLFEFTSMVAGTPSAVVLTYRPEYHGALSGIAGGATISLAALCDSDMSALVTEALGHDVSVLSLGMLICERASGNPFFAEEMVRELIQRGVLVGKRGAYSCVVETADVGVPATLQAAISARIDHLDIAPKDALYCAAVIGASFDTDLLERLTGTANDAALNELVRADLIGEVAATPRSAQYSFRHPLIRSVAYNAQLKSSRAALHRRLAEAIENSDPRTADQHAAVIAEHVEAAGDLRTAWNWHLRAGTWSATRDVRAARISWRSAYEAADRLPGGDPETLAQRIMPRTLLCATAWRVGTSLADSGFDELKELADAAGDQMSSTIITVLLAADHYRQCHYREAAELASKVVAAAEAIPDSETAIRLIAGVLPFIIHVGEVTELLRLSQHVIDLTEGDPAKGHWGNSSIGSPLAVATMARGVARAVLGLDGWKADLRQAISIARAFDLTSRAMVTSFVYGTAVSQGWLLADRAAIGDSAEILELAKQFGDDLTLATAKIGRLIVRTYDDKARHGVASEEIAETRELALRAGTGPWVPLIDVAAAINRANGGDVDGAINGLRELVDDLYQSGEMGWRGVAVSKLVELLLTRGTNGDGREARDLTGRLAAVPTEPGVVGYEVPLLCSEALLARADGDEAGFRQLVGRYGARAVALGFEGHGAAAAALQAQGVSDGPRR